MNDSKLINNLTPKFHWKCKHTWLRSAKNTSWCLLGCSVGDLGTILFFQIYLIHWTTLYIMILAIINGLITSLILETFVLLKQLPIFLAFKTALSMSFISMISMEVAMNLVDWLVIGEARLVLWVIPIMLFAGFITPLPYNYFRLKKYNISCH